MKVFNYSIVYLMALFAFMLIDHYVDTPLVARQVMQLQRVG
jgi:heme o synthase